MKGYKLKWQPAKHHEASAISDLLNIAYRSSENWTDETILLDEQRASQSLIKRDMNDDSTHYFVCRNDTVLFACIRLMLVGNEAYIGSFAVLPIYQNVGVGTHLLTEIEQVCIQEYGVTLFTLSVLTGQDALKRLCEKHGYHKTGVSEPYPTQLNIGGSKRSGTMIEFFLKKAQFD